VAEEVSLALKEMQVQNGELKELLKNFLNQSQQAQNGTTKLGGSPAEQGQKIEIAELKSELKKLKAMILDSKSSSSLNTQVVSSTTPKSWSPSQETLNKLPPWMEQDSGKNPLSFDDPYDRVEKAHVRDNSDSVSPSSLEEPPRSKDFGKIMQMVKNGQTPDDIKQIDDKPIDPNFKIERGQRSAPLKPWQKNSSETDQEKNVPRVQEITSETKETNGSSNQE